MLRHWSGLSNREIAGVLDTSESSIESLLVRARAAIVASGPAEEECVALRRRLTDNRDLTPAQSGHVARCKGCARAHQRLNRVAAAVVVLGLVPRAHVAQALASAVPGFTATAGVGAGATSGAGLAAKVAGTKTAIAAVGSLLAVAAAAPVVLHVTHHLPTTLHHASVSGITRKSPLLTGRAPCRQGRTRVLALPPTHNRPKAGSRNRTPAGVSRSSKPMAPAKPRATRHPEPVGEGRPPRTATRRARRRPALPRAIRRGRTPAVELPPVPRGDGSSQGGGGGSNGQ